MRAVCTGVNLRVITVAAGLVTTAVYAQELQTVPAIRSDVTVFQVTQIPQPPEPPAGAGAWSLIVHTSGGFTGRGAGSVTISSDGRVQCVSLTCASRIEPARLTQVGTVLTAIGTAWVRQSASICSDCLQTTAVLKRREGDVVRTYVASWDASQAVPPELRELRRLAFELQADR